MDLKRYEGKNVLVQLRGREEWLVAFALAADDEDEDEDEAPLPAPEVMLVNQSPNGEGGTPAAFPFIHAKVIDGDGTLEIKTGNGGSIHVQLSPEIIHSVSVVACPAQKRRVQVAESGGIIHPG